MFRRKTVLTAAAALFAVSSGLAQDGFKIVINPSNSASTLTKADVANLFLRKQVEWEDGRPVAPVDQTDAAVREAFSRDVLGMPATSAFSHAQEAAAAGRGAAPVSVATDREVLAFVRLKPGAIGYVSTAASVQGVKVVSLGGRPPGASSEPVRVGGTIRAPARILDVRPRYPEIAKSARTQGTVELEIVIGPTGTVDQARVIRSVPMLDRSALDAVRQWKYAPTIVNGMPVAVVMTVGITFTL